MNETMAAWAPRALSVLRIFLALLLIEHGTGKLFSFPVVPMFANIQLNSMFGAAAVIELVGGALLADRPVHEAGRLHSFGHGGHRIFHGARREGVLSGLERR
jgi:hypothetical protein